MQWHQEGGNADIRGDQGILGYTEDQAVSYDFHSTIPLLFLMLHLVFPSMTICEVHFLAKITNLPIETGW